MAKASINRIIKKQLSEVRKQISRHEKALKSLRAQEKNIRKAARLLGGENLARSGSEPNLVTGKSKGEKTNKNQRTNWERVANSLPNKFTINDLAATSGARGKSRAYLHQIINRWKKSHVIKSAGRATYQKI